MTLYVKTTEDKYELPLIVEDSYYVGCINDNCGCEMEHPGGWKTYEAAVNAWNRRAK